MKKRYVSIEHDRVQIPAILWGEPGHRILIAVHGNLSHKEDKVIALLAEKAASMDFCLLSFDLPQHGERMGDSSYACTPWNGMRDIRAVYQYAKTIGEEISLFACSMGAYFTMLAYPQMQLKQLLFLSPVVNMAHIIEDMMSAFGISENRLEAEKVIPLPIGQTLDWAYYSFVKVHTVQHERKCPMSILYGEKDDLCARADVVHFADRYHAALTVVENGAHYFHTEPQLKAFCAWLDAWDFETCQPVTPCTACP